MKLVVGLGNPGSEYEWTRHNIGFLALDEFLSKRKLQCSKSRDGAVYSKVDFSGRDLFIIQPQTFMNRSGQAVGAWVRKLGVLPEELLVLHDEADMEPGRLQLKKGGGSGGHNGLESIFEHLGNRDFYRLRIGVGKDPNKLLADYVLERTSKKALQPLAVYAAEALEIIMELGPAKAMNRVNQKAT